MDPEDMRKLGWPAYGTPPQESPLDVLPEGATVAEEYVIEVTEVNEPGPLVETRDLLCRLHGTPDECGEPNPYLAEYKRLKGTALPRSPDGPVTNNVSGTVDYGYWSALNLGYIESVRVRPNLRKKGIGVALLNYAVDHMSRLGITRIYSFAVNPEGSKLLESGGFAPQTPGDPDQPWRRWFAKS